MARREVRSPASNRGRREHGGVARLKNGHERETNRRGQNVRQGASPQLRPSRVDTESEKLHQPLVKSANDADDDAAVHHIQVKAT